MLFSRIEVSEYARKIGKSERTLWRWIKEGCNPRDPKSLRKWQVRNEIRQTPIERARRRRRDNEQKALNDPLTAGATHTPPTNGESLPPAGKRGAAAALERLEHQEEESHRRLQAALQRNDPLQIQACQDFWLKCSETLRRLDLAVELARRSEEEQIPKKLGQDVAGYISDWLRIAFVQFLSSEARPLMGIHEVGESKHYAFERFKGILDLVVQSSLRTNSPIPDWAAEKVKESWNVTDSDAI
jgi:hypothetical protein